MKQTKAISAVMPVRNGEKYLDNLTEIIDSNLAENDELIVINDNSDDGTLNKLQSWAKRNSKIRVITNKGDGIVDALNLGISESHNEWIARFDVDDLYSSNRLTIQRESISSNHVAIFSDYHFFASQNDNLGTIPVAITDIATKLSLISGQRTAHSSAVFNKLAFTEVGMYRKQDFPAEDLSLWLRLSRMGEFYSIPEVLMKYRISQQSITSTMRIESFAKKLQLLAEIGIQDEIISEAFEQASMLFAEYEKYTFENQRKLLFIRDLILVCKKKNYPRSMIKEILGISLKEISNTGLFFAALKLNIEKKRRNLIRN